MTYVLGTPQCVNGYRITMICAQFVTAQIGKQGGYARCSKEPAFVLVQNGTTTTALDMTGAVLPLDRISALCPDAAPLLA